MKNKFIFALALLILTSGFTASFVFGQTLNDTVNQYLNNAPVQITSSNQVLNILSNIVGLVYRLFFIATIFFVLLAAFNFLVSGGSTEKVQMAQKQLLYAAIAVAIALISMGAGAIIKNFIESSANRSSDLKTLYSNAIINPTKVGKRLS